MRIEEKPSCRGGKRESQKSMGEIFEGMCGEGDLLNSIP